MKWILFFNLLVLLGLSLADAFSGIEEFNPILDALPFLEETGLTHQVRRGALKRVVRASFSGMSSQYLPKLEATIISNCRENRREDDANKLQTTYDELKTCIKKKTIFITPKDQFIANVEDCSRDAIQRTKSCLGDEQKYFPEFILDLAKSVISFMYDDFDIMRVDLAACIPRFNRYDVQKSYVKCLTDTSTKTHDSDKIPESKASFCEKFIPASRCFTDMIKDTCDRTSNLDRLREDYINAMTRPCDKKESSE